jgi:hypothetical protein
LTALLPMTQGIAAHLALAKAADGLVAGGDARARGQLMADVMVERVTGQAAADAVPVDVQVVLDAETLLDPGSAGGSGTGTAADDAAARGTSTDEGMDLADLAGLLGPARSGGDAPAWLSGYGPVPGPWARHLVLHGQAPRWIRRLYTRPGTGELVGMDSKRRLFTEGQRRFITARDHLPPATPSLAGGPPPCRTPWCEAPIRHADHVIPAEEGGPTSIRSGAGRCVACNHAKQAPGWRERPGHAGAFMITTPTGHAYRSRAPVLIHRVRRTPIRVVIDHWPRTAA